jgi:small subunit ribosomal protein S20
LVLANIKSQIKRNKQAEVARERNKSVKSALKTSLKRFNEAALVSADEAGVRLKEAVVALDRAASDKVIHANEASRKKSVLMKKYSAVVANPPAPAVEEEKPKKKVAAKTGAKAPAKKPAAKKPAAKKTGLLKKSK